MLNDNAKRSGDITKVFIDDRSGSYLKQYEVVEIITNRMLAREGSTGRIVSVTKENSLNVPGIQAVDILTGAINASHLRYLDSSTEINSGKVLAVGRLAKTLGWDDLCYDTMPNLEMNIWHFPREYRDIPRTRSVEFDEDVPYVTEVDLEQAEGRHS